MKAPDDRKKPPARHRDVDAEGAGQRLDNFVLASLKGVPRSHVYRLIRSGQVRVNSGRSRPGYRLEAGDRVRIPPVRPAERAAIELAPGDVDWLAGHIVYEDTRLLVLDKPAGVAVHGGSGQTFGVIEALRALRPDARTLELVHRLDRDTSGCLLVAKRRSTLRTLHALLREGRIEKRYLALVKGDWQLDSTVVDEPLLERRRTGQVKVSVDAAGRAARSTFRLIERCGRTAAYVEVRDGAHASDPRARGLDGPSDRGRRPLRGSGVQRGHGARRPAAHVPARARAELHVAGRRGRVLPLPQALASREARGGKGVEPVFLTPCFACTPSRRRLRFRVALIDDPS